MMIPRRALGSMACLTLTAIVACSAPSSGAPSSSEEAPSTTDEITSPADLVVTPQARRTSRGEVSFDLVPLAKFAPCFAQYPDDPYRAPSVHVRIVRDSSNDEMTLTGRNIKPGLKFDLFTVERSLLNAQGANDPAFRGFGLAWYQSDLEADSYGSMRATVRTILLDQIFGFDPDVNLEPRNTFHVGFWFNDPNDAAACGFDVTKPTPFNGEHKAGPLAMISVPNARTNLGPLCTKPDWSTSPVRCSP